MKAFGTLDRYTLSAWTRIFVLTAIGAPLVSIMINLTDKLSRLLDKGVTWKQIAISYAYALPGNVFIVMPAAVLFATVFTVGALSRHSELTAAKAGGVSFHRLALPMFLAGLVATALDIVVGELAPGATDKSMEIQKEKPVRATEARFNFVFRANEGWVYSIRALNVKERLMTGPVLERAGTGSNYPTISVIADSATWNPKVGHWQFKQGAMRLVGDSARIETFRFDRLRLRSATESPVDLLADPKPPEAMRYTELGRYIDALRRSGNDVNKLVVEQALKLALPATCFIIALFGAPLAVSSPRGGTAIGFAISLSVTIVFLLMIQISKAVGSGGLMDPNAAAWIPNVAFLLAAVVLLWRVRT